MDDFWFLRVGEYISFWPGVVIMVGLYFSGVVAAFRTYRVWWKRVLYVLGLTVSMAILFDFLELVVPY